MLFYFGIYIVLLLIAFWDFQYPSKKGKLIFFIPIIIFFIIIGGLRWNTGNDWLPYYRYFEYFDWDTYYSKATFEPGYSQLTRLVIALGGDYTVFLIVYTILLVGLRSFFLYRHVNSILLACLLYYGNNLFDFAATRQWLGISILLLSIPFIIKRKFIPFLVIMLIAMSVHLSLITFLPAYFIFHKKWSTFSQVTILLLCVVIGYTGVFAGLMSTITSWIPDDGSRIYTKANAYMEMNEELLEAGGSGKSMLSMILGIAKRALVIPVLIYFKKIIPKYDKNYLGYLNLFIFGNALYFLLGNLGLGLGRMATAFYPFEIILLCLIVDYSKNRKLWFLIVVLYSFVKLIFTTSSLDGIYVPYYWIFDTEFPREHYNFLK